MSIQKKLIVVGDGDCGKTCLLVAFAKDEFLETYVPTVFENYVADVEINGKTIQLSLWDTSGQEDYDRLRPIQYTETDVALICFNVVWYDSFSNVSTKWVPEVTHFCPKVPIILVGTKSDLRTDLATLQKLNKYGKRQVSLEEAQNLAKKFGAITYIECSSKTRINVRNVFVTAAKSTLRSRIKKKTFCILI